MNSLRFFLVGITLAVLLGSTQVLAADPSITVAALASPDNVALIIQVTFSQDVTAENCRPGDCFIIDPTRFNAIIRTATAVLDSKHANIVSIIPSIPLDPNAQYTVIINNLQTAAPKGQPQPPRFGKTLQSNVMMTPPSKPKRHSLPCLKLPSGGLIGKNIDAANGRDDSDFYFSGQTTHSRGKDFVGTYDFKADLSTRQGLPGACGFFADLKGGDDPNGDPDSLKLGVKWDLHVHQWKNFIVLNQLRWSNATYLESTQDFTNKNFIYTSDFTLVLKNFPRAQAGKKLPQVYFRPRAGIEVGANLRSAVPAADGRSIARAKFGTGLMFYFPILAVVHDITLETQYDRRWPLRDEVNQSLNNSVFTAVNINTKPRDYVKETFTVNSTKFIGFSVAYEYGALPPIFKLVDSKFTIGLNVKAAFK